MDRREILYIPCKQLNMSIKQITSQARLQDHVFARIAISAKLRREGHKIEQIALILKRDHSTISHYLKTYTTQISRNKKLQYTCKQLNPNTHSP